MAESLLVNAAKEGNLEAVRERLESGDDVDEKNGNDTALIWAACNGHTEVVRLLIDWGANLSIKTGEYTPYRLAEHYKHTDTMALLAAATQQPRGAPRDTEKWLPMGESAVAFVGHYRALEKKLTHVFNFETRERFIISENLKTKAADSLTQPTPFDDLPASAIAKAFAEFTRLGGTADRDFALHGATGIDKPRKPHGLET